MTRNFGALNFPHGKGKSVIFLMPEENKFRENVATQPEAGVQGVVLRWGCSAEFTKIASLEIALLERNLIVSEIK